MLRFDPTYGPVGISPLEKEPRFHGFGWLRLEKLWMGFPMRNPGVHLDQAIGITCWLAKDLGSVGLRLVHAGGLA